MTRYALALPLKTLEAEETLQAMIKYVFCYFSFPSIIRSDNGAPFNSTLIAEFSKYIGARHITILPYNPQANNAESSVKRVAEMLTKHTQLFRHWDLALPTITFSLNQAIHTSIETSPFFQVFGRHPISIPELEDSTLQETTSTGPELVTSLSGRMIRSWNLLREISKGIREAVNLRADALMTAKEKRQQT